MGLFRSTAEKELDVTCHVLGMAIAQVRLEMMPPDYIEFTVENNRRAFTDRLEAVSREKGPEKARMGAVKSVRLTADGALSQQRASTAGLKEDAESIVNRILDSQVR